MEFDSPYLTKQIIAYIGNKRKLLSLIYKALSASRLDVNAPLTFADLFCGSGVVSRFAKMLGFEVHCNDWEPYAEVLAKGFVALNKSEFDALFADYAASGEHAPESVASGSDAPAETAQAQPGFASLIERIHALPSPEGDDCYISRYYAAHNDDVQAADFRTERLFYTHQNALMIDKIRAYIERHFPDHADKRRHILLSLLLYEAATHTNTSGVFKAFHKGFGGHGKDALSRILAPIALHEPVLIDSASPVHVYRKDANVLVRELPPLDVVYLDPPYNQHQYGSNYHLLNTIAEWDKIPAPLDLDENGVLQNKAAIRADWVKTRSAYCYKKSASSAFRDLIEHIRARLILISYSSDGIIPFSEMKDICMAKGYVSIVTSGYTVYRGGKQSNSRKSADIEFVLAIDTSRPAEAECEERIDKVIFERTLLLLLKRRFNRARLLQRLSALDSTHFSLSVGEGEKSRKSLIFTSPDALTLSLSDDCALEDYTSGELSLACSTLEACTCETKQEELSVLITLVRESAPHDKKACTRYLKQIPATLKKLAQKKYRDIFYIMLFQVRALSTVDQALYALISESIESIAQTAEIRFTS